MADRQSRPVATSRARSPRAGGAAARVTIADVAHESGVSVSAVSKVLRDAYGVSDDMRARVNAAIEKLGYRPHAAARAMRGSSYTIGVMVTSLTSPFQPEVAQGISDTLERSRYHEILTIAGATPALQQERIEALVDRQVDGLILIAPWMAEPWLKDLASRIPTVVVARHGGSTRYDSVVSDDYEGARLTVEHLVALGHRRIVHTSQPDGALRRPHVLSHTARRDGYMEAMTAHGLEPDVIETEYSEEGGYSAARVALTRRRPPTAIFAGADIAAFGVLRAAEELGMKVPEDVSVTGYDNIYASTIGRISLTTVDQSGHHTGELSAQLLLERIAGRDKAVHQVLTPRLIERTTSAGLESPKSRKSR